jgi:hypothetical protein
LATAVPARKHAFLPAFMGLCGAALTKLVSVHLPFNKNCKAPADYLNAHRRGNIKYFSVIFL